MRAAIEYLYATFAAYTLDGEIDSSPITPITADEQRELRQPLRTLHGGRLLRRYAVKAMTTWGSVRDFKHFLPRLLELTTESREWADDTVLLGKLPYGEWRTWPDVEQRAIEAWFAALWTEGLAGRAPLHESVALAVAAQIDLEPYVAQWEATHTPAADAALAQFIDVNQHDVYRGRTGVAALDRLIYSVDAIDRLAHHPGALAILDMAIYPSG